MCDVADDRIFFVLDEARKPRPVSAEEWREAIEERMARLVKARTEDGDPWRVGLWRRDGAMVSTIFLGIRHAGGVFETLVQVPELNGLEDGGRCWSCAAAEEMHEEWVAWVEARL